MVKKKYFLFSSIFLLLLLLGLLSTSFAYEYVVTIEDCQTLANTYYGSKLPNTLKTKLWEFVEKMYDDYNKDLIIINIQNDNAVGIKGLDSSKITSQWNIENINMWGVSYNGTWYYQSLWYSPGDRWTNPSWSWSSINTSTESNITFGSGGQYRTSYLLVSNDLGSLYTGPYQSSNVLTLNQPQFFTFTYNNNLVIKELEDDISSLGLYVALFSGDTHLKNLGYLEQADLISSVIKEEYYWDKYQHNFIPYKAEVIDFTNSENIYSINIVPNDLANTYIQYVIYPEDETQFNIQYASYMIINNMTSVSGDYINIDSTFSDDNYYNTYIGTITSQKENEEAQDRTDEIINAITGFDSGDAESYVNFGEMPQLDDPTSNLLSYLLSRISYCFTEDFSSSYIDVPFLSTTTRVYASQFDFLPTQLKTIIAAFAILALIRRYFPKIHGLVTAVSTANIGSFAEKIQGGLSVIDIL